MDYFLHFIYPTILDETIDADTFIFKFILGRIVIFLNKKKPVINWRFYISQ